MAEMHMREIPLSVAGRNYCVEDNSEAQISCLLAFDETYSSIYNRVHTRIKERALLEPS